MYNNVTLFTSIILKLIAIFFNNYLLIKNLQVDGSVVILILTSILRINRFFSDTTHILHVSYLALIAQTINKIPNIIHIVLIREDLMTL